MVHGTAHFRQVRVVGHIAEAHTNLTCKCMARRSYRSTLSTFDSVAMVTKLVALRSPYVSPVGPAVSLKCSMGPETESSMTEFVTQQAAQNIAQILLSFSIMCRLVFISVVMMSAIVVSVVIMSAIYPDLDPIPAGLH